MKVPNEILLDILHPLDYSSLLRLKFTASRFHRLSERNATILQSVGDDVIFEMKYSSPDSFEVALTAAADIVALHPIVSIKIWCKAIESGLADGIFSYLPSATYARDVNPYCVDQAHTTGTQIEAFIARFPSLESANLDRIPVDFDWTILRSKHLLRLPNVCISPETLRVGKLHLTEAAVEEIIRFCSDYSKLQPEQTKFLGLWRRWRFSQEFVDRVIQVIESSPRHITVRIEVELLDINSEEKELPGYDAHVLFPSLELDEDNFEQRLVVVNGALIDGRRWANVDYYSRRSQVVVFVSCHERSHPSWPDTATIEITNDPIHKELYEV